MRALDEPVPALSFEFTTIAREVAQPASTGSPRSAPTGSTSRSARAQSALPSAAGFDADEMAAHFAALPHDANSGDVYAVLS